ncbi:endonuclease/exonuclease/phosphatase family protein [Desulfococcaceae bacterium HSG9]|nr:endonuclease/exonuclease/phosphatase family protein [Desulfococcaceae bacterium HSG9]
MNSTTTDLLTVITYNIGTIDGRLLKPEKIVATIGKNVTPDLLLLQEVPNVKFAIELAESLKMPFYLFSTYSDAGMNGLAILSRYPLAWPEIIRLNRRAAFVVEMTVGDNHFLVSSVHLERVKKIPKQKDKFALSRNKAFALSMTEWFQNTPRSLAVDTLLERLDKRACKYVIIGGDFNTFPFSTAIRKMDRVYDDALLNSKDYLSGTYKKLALPVQPRIDFIFHSRNIWCLEGAVVKEGDGDHFPVMATLLLLPD